ncbi:hypothetical protein BDN71DRAFT_316599 [Pleurotus eryngii]|uniref:Uncharacterized protein n=1 Tax=Pleurotus eryngii TaxID=5323 RepID=A0A9P5ZJK8_PLEER|nr:hypothetical protein BDN71DRAFT_316599 [Pleurotus eryngii]
MSTSTLLISWASTSTSTSSLVIVFSVLSMVETSGVGIMSIPFVQRVLLGLLRREWHSLGLYGPFRFCMSKQCHMQESVAGCSRAHRVLRHIEARGKADKCLGQSDSRRKHFTSCCISVFVRPSI